MAREPVHRSQQGPSSANPSTRRPTDEGDDLARLMDVMSVDGAKPTTTPFKPTAGAAGAAPKPPSQPSGDSAEMNA